MQATEAIKLITGIGEPMVGRMLLYDAAEMTFTTIKIRKNPNCPVCGIPADQVELIDYEQFCGVPAHDHSPMAVATNGHQNAADVPIPLITAVELKQRLDNGDDLFLLDVRNPQEWEIASLENTTARIPKPKIQLAAEDVKAARRQLEETSIGEIPRDREVIVYCRSGARSADVIKTLRELGYDPHKLVNMEGGILAWAKNIDRTMPVY
jgi:adenylyltransferase/sulfurtransferase